jgi:hypothetical protein
LDKQRLRTLGEAPLGAQDRGHVGFQTA